MQLDGTQIEEGGNNMRFRKCGSVLLVLVLVMSMMIGGGLTVFAEVGPGVSQSAEQSTNNGQDPTGRTGVGISTLPPVGQTTWAYSEVPSVNISYIVSKNTCTFQYVVTSGDVHVRTVVMDSEAATKSALLNRPQSSKLDNEYFIPFTLPNGTTNHSYWITRQNLVAIDEGIKRHFADAPNQYKYYDTYARGVKILDTIEYYEDDPMLETHYRVTAILDPSEVMWLMNFMYAEGIGEMYLADPFTLPDGRQVMVRVTEQQIIDISHNTPTETVYLPITEYFPINP